MPAVSLINEFLNALVISGLVETEVLKSGRNPSRHWSVRHHLASLVDAHSPNDRVEIVAASNVARKLKNLRLKNLSG